MLKSGYSSLRSASDLAAEAASKNVWMSSADQSASADRQNL